MISFALVHTLVSNNKYFTKKQTKKTQKNEDFHTTDNCYRKYYHYRYTLL